MLKRFFKNKTNKIRSQTKFDSCLNFKKTTYHMFKVQPNRRIWGTKLIIKLLQHHEKNVREKKRIIKDLGKTIKSRDSENFSMDNDLAELNVTVNERRHIDDVNGRWCFYLIKFLGISGSFYKVFRTQLT